MVLHDPENCLKSNAPQPSQAVGWILTVLYAVSMGSLLFFCYTKADSRYEQAVVAMQLLTFSSLVSLITCTSILSLAILQVVPWWTVITIGLISAISVAITVLNCLPYDA